MTSGPFKRFFTKSLDILIALLAFLLYPTIVLIDSLCRDGSILFESPEKRTRNSAPVEHKFWQFFRKKMHSPIYKIWIHGLLEMVFIGILFISLSKPRSQNESSGVEGKSTLRNCTVTIVHGEMIIMMILI